MLLQKKNNKIDWELISHISKECRMPLCYGGGVDSVEKVEKLVSLGVEKVMKKIKDGRGSFLSKVDSLNKIGGLTPDKNIPDEIKDDLEIENNHEEVKKLK